MVNSSIPCEAPRTTVDKTWTYYEYYVGDKDQKMRKDGYGRHHWTGAESLECYEGNFVRNTMHGVGEYRYRQRGACSLAATYGGHFYNNCMHGYGRMSYADGRVFSGLYYNNLRWGPGIESYACLRENVGFWEGARLLRLSWKPLVNCVIPDLLSSSVGLDIAAQNRSILTTNIMVIGQLNSALELLKQYGATPEAASQKWIKLYPDNCTDAKSQLYHTDVFDRAYYDTKINTLQLLEVNENVRKGDSTIASTTPKFYAWNNNKKTIHMMKHCYQHEKQRSETRIKLEEILNGTRMSFKPAAQHELDSRTVLMASYLGHVKNVAQLINENDVHPNITDMQGNSAIMYAACGCHPDIIHFLVEAGAEVDYLNDACCSPLGVALINYTCVYFDIPPNRMLEAILPPASTTATQTEQSITEWIIERSSPSLNKSPSNKTIKTVQGSMAKKAKSSLSAGSLKLSKVMPSKEVKRDTKSQNEYNEIFSDDKQLYLNIVSEYNILVNDLYTNVGGTVPVQYLFEVNDMVKEIDVAFSLEEQKKVADKKDMKTVSKVIRDTIKPSKDLLSSSLNKKLSLDMSEKIKREKMNQIMQTITQLLLDGADPRKIHCPQPALYFAIISQSSDLVRELVKHGADVNEVYSQSLGYTPIDIAISGPLTNDNLDVIRTLLENGAKVSHTLPRDESIIPETNGYIISSPTLLHAVLSKKPLENETAEDIRQQILELLLEYGCDPIAQYKGRSAVDIAMSKPLDIFDIFIENKRTDLNAIINDSNQTIIVKMFHLPYCKTITVAERMQMLTNLLIFGVDPLVKCQNEDQIYDNIFVLTKKILLEMEKAKPVSTPKQDPKKIKSDVKGKKTENPKTTAQTIKSSTKVLSGDDIGDYKQMINLVTNCARLLFIRWIQAKLLKELIQIVNRYKHRHWNVILREYKNGTCSNLWLNPIRCLEIWDILKTTQKRIYNDKRLLKYVLYIIQYYYKNGSTSIGEPKMTAKEKVSIETEVGHLLRDHISGKMPHVMKRPYVTPELTPISEVAKFNICFECATPLTDEKIPCGLCKLVDFCSFECMELNIERINCHPCSSYLKKNYFPTPTHSSSEDSEEIAMI